MPHAETRAQVERSRRRITESWLWQGHVLREVGRIAPKALALALRRVEKREKKP
jgi:hypothetical protein